MIGRGAYYIFNDFVDPVLHLQITAECLIAVVLSLVGTVLCAGDLKNILMENEMSKQYVL
jgi:hypothetical protein